MTAVTAADTQQFAEQGYLIIRQAFVGAELDRLRELARGVQATVRATLPPGARYWFADKTQKATPDMPPDLRARATWGVNELPRKALFEPELVNVLGHPVLDAVTRALLGERPTAWGIKMLWSPQTAGYDLGWHRDQMPRELYDYAHTKPAGNDHVQYNAALNHDESFIVVPGSHRRPLTETEWDALRNDRTAELPRQMVAELGPGDVVFMDAHALHRGRNAVDSDRLTLHYSARAEYAGVYPWGHEGHFEWITSDAFIDQLDPAAAAYYHNLREVPRVDHAMAFFHDAARAAGWDGQIAERKHRMMG